MFASLVVFPSITKSSIFSFATNFLGEAVWAKDNNLPALNISNSQTMPLLVAPTNTESNHKKSGENITTVGGVALLSETGPSGSLANVDGANNSDQISIYTVRKGDTLSSIAKMFDVSKNTILWANDIKAGSVSPGDRLVILPVSGIRYVIQKGDTIASLAKKYKADKEDIAQFNDVNVNDALVIGDTVIIPEGQLADTPNTSAPKGSKLVVSTGKNITGYFIRPITGGVRTQGIHGHNGVDLASKYGTPIMASASGVVIVSKTSGYNGGFGNFIVVEHPNGTQTLYGHLSENLVSVGGKVEQGDVIGKMGSTGKSTGNHIHFEIHGAKNPF